MWALGGSNQLWRCVLTARLFIRFYNVSASRRFGFAQGWLRLYWIISLRTDVISVQRDRCTCSWTRIDSGTFHKTITLNTSASFWFRSFYYLGCTEFCPSNWRPLHSIQCLRRCISYYDDIMSACRYHILWSSRTHRHNYYNNGIVLFWHFLGRRNFWSCNAINIR